MTSPVIHESLVRFYCYWRRILLKRTDRGIPKFMIWLLTLRGQMGITWVPERWSFRTQGLKFSSANSILEDDNLLSVNEHPLQSTTCLSQKSARISAWFWVDQLMNPYLGFYPNVLNSGYSNAPILFYGGPKSEVLVEVLEARGKEIHQENGANLYLHYLTKMDVYLYVSCLSNISVIYSCSERTLSHYCVID